MTELEEDLEMRYKAMLKRCHMEDQVDEECEPEGISMGDYDAYYPKPEAGIGAGVKFERLRRVTGYLSGRGIDGMNNAKQAEVRDRVRHG